MDKDPTFELRQRFHKYIKRNWILNNHSLKDESCVYVMVSFDILNYNSDCDIVYVGSTTCLKSRYKSHKVPGKIQSSGRCNLMYFIPMSKGFYDYEMKLIKKLQPLYNKQHK